MTSHDVVGRLRRITGEKSIGHLGTLDPMATGVLPLLMGKYTRLAQYFSSAEKSYSGAIRFGFSTDTYDAEGKPVGLAVTPVLTVISRAWFCIVNFFASIRDHSADAFRWQKMAEVFATYF